MSEFEVPDIQFLLTRPHHRCFIKEFVKTLLVLDFDYLAIGVTTKASLPNI